VARCRELTLRISQLEREITQIVSRLAPTLVALPGCGGLSAAKMFGETAGVGRFRSEAAFARWNGTAPIPVWSGNARKFRLNRGGNRQVNAALHWIAITSCLVGGRGRAYLRVRMASVTNRREAPCLLRRRLSDEVLRRLLVDAMQRDGAVQEPAA
jgi:transposase